YIALILDPSGGMEKVYKWGTFFILTWITSLICAVIIDGISVWNGHKPLSSIVIDAIFVPGSLPPLTKNLLRALCFSLIALCVLIIKTKIMDRTFSMTGKCALVTLAGGLAMNTVLLLVFLYSNVI